MLDGSTASFQNAINIWNYFGNCSGLRINIQKTKAIWIGASKDNNELKLERSDVEFVCNDFFGTLETDFHVDITKISD